jgi:hypothetical protein
MFEVKYRNKKMKSNQAAQQIQAVSLNSNNQLHLDPEQNFQ